MIKRISDNIALIIPRIVVGLVFLTEGIQKYLFPNLLGTERFLKIGFSNPAFWAYFTGSFEIVCGFLVLFGLLTRLASIPLFIIMTVAFVTTKYPLLVEKGFWIFAHEYRTDFAMTMLLLVILFYGAGNVSLDYKIFSNTKKIKEILMENIVFHKADTRGHEDHGWLNTYHNFSFGDYHASDRMQFGTLRVLNDDTVAAGTGFGRHPHNNMEIISIPLEGELEHKDSMGNTQVIKTGDIQVMSAGTGIFHSEYNRDKNKEVKFLQIWVYPNKLDVQPRYDQVTLDPSKRINKLQLIVSPNPKDEGVWIYQDAWFYFVKLQKDHKVNYQVKKKGNGVFCFLLIGEMYIKDNHLDKRDAVGIWEVDSIDLNSLADDSEILIMDVPMKNSI